MTISLRTGIAVGVLFGSVMFAHAQAVIELSPEQRTTIYSTITREPVREPPPADFNFRVGVAVPAEVELYAVPEAVEVPAVRRYRYTVWNNQIVLVDPSSRKVVQIIRR
jgi:hypothetical protein